MIYSNSPRSPLNSNTIMSKITKELRNIEALEESSTSAAETLSIGLSGIADLYNCISQMLIPPPICYGAGVNELLEASAKLLELNNAAMQMAMQMRESSELLRCSLTQKQDSFESSIARFVSMRKKIVKGSKEILLSLRRFLLLESSDDEGIAMVIKALRCVCIISVSVHENLLLFLSLKPKSGGRKSIFAKLMRKGRLVCEGGEVSKNELENVDVAICGLCCENDEKMRLVCKRLEALESGIEGIESGLESVFREISKIRVLLFKSLSP